MYVNEGERFRKMLFFLLLMLLFRSVCHKVSNQADKLALLAILIISRRFAHLFKWAFPGQCYLNGVKIWDKIENS